MTLVLSPADLFSKFLSEPNIAERVKMTHAAVDGRPADEALSMLFSALNLAVDQLRAVSEIAISMGLSATSINEELGRKREQRSSQYLEYRFRMIVDGRRDGDPLMWEVAVPHTGTNSQPRKKE